MKALNSFDYIKYRLIYGNIAVGDISHRTPPLDQLIGGIWRIDSDLFFLKGNVQDSLRQQMIRHFEESGKQIPPHLRNVFSFVDKSDILS